MRRRHPALSFGSPLLTAAPPTLLAGALALASACSNVDRGPIAACEQDSDCGTGSICSLAQGNICVPEALPPQAVLGFDIQQGDLRIELGGCDPEVSRELGGSELRVQSRDGLVHDYAIRASQVRSVVNCGGGECEGECDEDQLTCTEQADALLGLSMASRLGLNELSSPKRDYVTVTDPPLPEGELPQPVSFTWPSYETALDPLAVAAQRLEITPPAESSPRSRYHRVIAADAPEELETAALERCQRAIIGNEGSVRTVLGTPVSGASIEFLYNEPIATDATVLGSGDSCVTEADCAPGWACNLEGRCGLDLSGVSAGSSTSVEEPPGAFAPAYLYTYCEGIVASEEPLMRQFLVRATPPAELGLPNMIYELAQPFIDPPTPGTLTEINIDGALCFPDWEAPEDVGFAVSGAPVDLIATELGTYSCCSTECLPSPEPDVEPTPPPSIDSCQSFERVRFETRWFNPDEQTWAFAGCVPTASNSDGSSGRFVREISECDAEDGCRVKLTLGEAEELSRNYAVSIVQPVGSLFQSTRETVVLEPGMSELPPFELQPRVQLRGSIVCVGSNCNAEGAVIAAERLRTETADGELPGPFYFQARVDAEGNFILPVDPGVYVVTAYPAVGQPGGPAPFQVVDLSAGSPEVEDVQGVPHAQLGGLELDDGVLVQVQLRNFDLPTTVLPIDTGSWTFQSDFPDEVDLNDPATCLSSATRGCLIRRIRPTDARISLLISGLFQFTARDRGGNECPEQP